MNLIFITPFPPLKGGISAYSKRTYDQLVSSGLNVEVLTFSSFSDLFKLIQLLNDKKYEALRLEYNLATFGLQGITILLGIIYTKFFHPHTILTINYHEVKRDIDIIGPIGKLYYWFYSLPFKRIYLHTVEAKEVLNQICKVPLKKIKVIPLGTYEFSNKEDFSLEINEKFQLGNKKLVLYFGYIHIHKGIEYLIKAINVLLESNPELKLDFKVLIVGSVRERKGLFKIFESKDKEYYQSLLDLQEKFNLKDIIQFSSYIEDKYVYSLLNRAEIVVLPYTNTEQSGVLNQALALSKPVVASNIGGLGETLRNVGVLVPPANEYFIAKALDKLLNEEAYYNEVKDSYTTLSQGISSQTVTKMFLEDLEDLRNAIPN